MTELEAKKILEDEGYVVYIDKQQKIKEAIDLLKKLGYTIVEKETLAKK